MNFKKRVNGSWHDTPHYIHNTSTDTITTLPADIYANDTTATVGLKGNTTQSGTPTPDNPIMPQGCGERTAQLFDENYPNIKVDTPTYRSIYVGDGTFTLSTTTVQYRGSADLFFLAGNVESGASTQNNGVWNGNPRTVTAVDGYVTIAYRYYTGDEASNPRSNDVMLNPGSTALPYEPWGIKIPISSADTTTPVYLGEVESTRRIKKLVLDGTENWWFYSDTSGEYGTWQFYVDNVTNGLPLSSALSNIAEYGATAPTRSRYPYAVYLVTSGTGIGFQMAGAKDTFPNITAWKSYLQQQYAAGTPVTIWYVLATEETGIVNEPLMKIGDYADTLSGVSIPVTAGGDTISVGTTVQPSEVSLNYHGWHPVADIHYFTP